MIWSRKPQTNVRLKCIDVVNEYGAVLEAEPYGVGMTIAESKLPFDMAIIKASLADVASTPGNSEAQIAELKAGFLELASFRSNGGDHRLTTGKLPTTRNEIAAFLGEHGPEIQAEAEIGKAVLAEKELLQEEWKILFELSKVMKRA